MGKRDRAIMELFFSTGLRLAELRSLNCKDINVQTREISVKGKRGKVRVVFLSDSSVDALKAYLDTRIDHLNPLLSRTILEPEPLADVERALVVEVLVEHDLR